MLTAGAAAKVGTRHDQNLGVSVGLLVQNKVRLLLARVAVVPPLVEQRSTKARALDGLKELFGDDGVGVDVGNLQGSCDALDLGKIRHACRAGRSAGISGSAGRGVLGRVHDAVQVLVIEDVLHFGVGNGDPGRRLGRRDVFSAGDVANVGELADQGAGRRHDRRHEVSPAAGALTSLKVTVRGGGTALLGCENVWVPIGVRLGSANVSGKED